MAWEWSHTAEGINSAYENLGKLSKKELLIILREWRYYELEQQDKYAHFRLSYNGKKLRKDVIVDAIWEKMEEYRTCTNGGHNAYACPDGCHLVSFSET